MCGFGLMCPLLPCLALTLIPVFGEIITDYCLKKISPVLMAKHSSGLVAPCLDGSQASSKREKAKKASKQRPRRERGGGGGEGPNLFKFLTTCMVQATKTMTMARAHSSMVVCWPTLLPSLRPFFYRRPEAEDHASLGCRFR